MSPRGDYDPRRLPEQVDDLLAQLGWAVAYVLKVSRPAKFSALADELETMTPVQSQAFTQRLCEKIRDAYHAKDPV